MGACIAPSQAPPELCTCDPPFFMHTQGFLYAFDCYGITLPGFPIQMGDIQVH